MVYTYSLFSGEFPHLTPAADIVSDRRPAGSPERRAPPLAGDDPDAKKAVTEFLDEFGFDSVDAGPLVEGRRFHRGTPPYCVPMDTDQMRAALDCLEAHQWTWAAPMEQCSH
jgi:predicted dinucleotide-binding enzyme